MAGGYGFERGKMGMTERPWWLRVTGTPPLPLAETPSNESPSPGWYPDPSGEARSRFWDGSRWTAHVGAGPSHGPGLGAPPRRFGRLSGIASLLRRGLASGIDALPLGAVNVPAALFLDSRDLRVVIAVVAGVAYLVPLIAVYGQTLGDRLVGIQVVEAGDGNLPGWRRSFLRYLCLDGVLQVVGTLYPHGVVWALVVIVGAALFDKSRQGLHDRAAGVIVVELPPMRS